MSNTYIPCTDQRQIKLEEYRNLKDAPSAIDQWLDMANRQLIAMQKKFPDRKFEIYFDEKTHTLNIVEVKNDSL